ncbi:MAG TPA: hypothetical protein VN776_00215 [Terracidiphilus sp.]|nr:hypothetical protein [Terracidiphilus sp.]
MSELDLLPKVEVLSIDTIDELADRLPHRHRYFTLLLAWDAPEIDQQNLIDLFRPLVDRGLAYLCAWGSHCEAVHDAVDLCVVEKELDAGESDCFLMTTWHANEPLKEAAWFFKMLAIPSENHVFVDFDRFAVSVGNPDWAQETDRYLSEGAPPDAEAQ